MTLISQVKAVFDFCKLIFAEENHGFSVEICGFSANRCFKKQMSFSEGSCGFSVVKWLLEQIFSAEENRGFFALWLFGSKI